MTVHDLQCKIDSLLKELEIGADPVRVRLEIAKTEHALAKKLADSCPNGKEKTRLVQEAHNAEMDLMAAINKASTSKEFYVKEIEDTKALLQGDVDDRDELIRYIQECEYHISTL